jgi:hypothetical protein
MTRYNLPEIQNGYELNKKGWFSIVVPEFGTNLIINPSFEAGCVPYNTYMNGSRTFSEGFSANNSAIAASTAYQYEAATSCKVTPKIHPVFYTQLLSLLIKHILRVVSFSEIRVTNTLCYSWMIRLVYLVRLIT